METKEVGFADKFKAAVSLAESVKTIVVKTVQQYHDAEDKLKTIRTLEKQLEEEYKAHPSVIDAKRLQGIKGDLATMLENARKGLKNGPMLAFEQAEEAKRKAEEARLAAIAKAEADKETARLVAEQKKVYDAAKKRGDAEAAEKAKEEAAAIKAEAAAMPAAVVVVEKTAPSVARGVAKKWRIKTADGKLITKDEFQKKVIRLRTNDLPGVEAKFFMLDHTAISGITDSLGHNHGIPGVEYYEVPA